MVLVAVCGFACSLGFLSSLGYFQRHLNVSKLISSSFFFVSFRN